jgi:hypothetical protein
MLPIFWNKKRKNKVEENELFSIHTRGRYEKTPKIMNLIDHQHTMGTVPYGQLKLVYYLTQKLGYPTQKYI